MAHRVLLVALFVCSILPVAGADEAPAKTPSIFDAPRQAALVQQVQGILAGLLKTQRYKEAEALLRQAIAKQPDEPTHLYNLACVLALQMEPDQALEQLKLAAAEGFADVEGLEADTDLASLRETERYKKVVETLNENAKTPVPPREVTPRKIVDEAAVVDDANTIWDARQGLFRPQFEFGDNPRAMAEAVVGHGTAGELVRGWQKEGTAAGLWGILYDNQDRQHSPLPRTDFPQLTPTAYSAEAKAAGMDSGLQTKLLFSVPVLGNSSMALTNGALWRSQPRIALTQAALMRVQALQYFSNQLYFYPEHRDYDVGHNGKPDGYGDVYPFNTPYVIISQGSSYTDQPFLQAVACTIAALPPETRQKLIATGTLMPAMQMIFRRSNRQVTSDEEYRTGAAHPPVFSGDNLDVEAMVRRAHDMLPGAVPPIVTIEVLEEDLGQPGVDYFEAGPREKVFETPAAVGRVYRTLAKTRRMRVRATAKELNNRPTTLHWSVLQGDADAISIKPVEPDGSVVELIIPWHERRPVTGNPQLETNRVDIAVFANNGACDSAPVIISHYFLDSEKREYGPDGRLVAVEYRSFEQGGNYADPALHTPCDWRDEYQYDSEGRRTGWTRTRGTEKAEFTSRGHRITKKDAFGRAAQARAIVYVMQFTTPGAAPKLTEQESGPEISYTYQSDADRIGEAATK